jgi:hypothetical protein
VPETLRYFNMHLSSTSCGEEVGSSVVSSQTSHRVQGWSVKYLRKLKYQKCARPMPVTNTKKHKFNSPGIIPVELRM